jgi:hypothetical protein
MLRMRLGERHGIVGGAMRIAAIGKIGRDPGRFCSAMPHCWYSRLGQGQGSDLRNAKGRGWSIRGGGLHARRGTAGLDEVQGDPSDLGGIGDDGKHLHGGAAAAAAERVHLADFGQQPRQVVPSIGQVLQEVDEELQGGEQPSVLLKY